VLRLEKRTDPLLAWGRFAWRMVSYVGAAAALIGGALLIGVLGYKLIAGFSWIDSLLNASMILSAMGPVDHVDSDAAKIFASCYALFSGIVFITSISIIAAPVFHRVMHSFHVEEDETGP
jgi:hypothetical protein